MKLNFYAFADESSPFINEQITALKNVGFDGVELRTVDEQNVSDISIEKAREVKAKFEDAGLKIWTLGSPLGKIEMGKDSFEEHLKKVRHTIELANLFNAENIRMFSFYIPNGKNPDEYRNEIIDRLSIMTELSHKAGITMCHENEKGIYGDTPERCLDILNSVKNLSAIFDPANFVQCGVDTKKAWELLKDRVKYLHIKDSRADGNVVPAGDGEGNVPFIVEDYVKRGGNSFTVEPHLTVFSALKDLEREGEEIKVGNAIKFDSKEEAFIFACRKFRKITEEISWK